MRGAYFGSTRAARRLRRPIDNVLSGRDAFDGEVVEELVHADAELFVVAVDGCPVRWLAAATGAAHPGEDGGDDVVAQGDEPAMTRAASGGTW